MPGKSKCFPYLLGISTGASYPSIFKAGGIILHTVFEKSLDPSVLSGNAAVAFGTHKRPVSAVPVNYKAKIFVGVSIGKSRFFQQYVMFSRFVYLTCNDPPPSKETITSSGSSFMTASRKFSSLGYFIISIKVLLSVQTVLKFVIRLPVKTVGHFIAGTADHLLCFFRNNIIRFTRCRLCFGGVFSLPDGKRYPAESDSLTYKDIYGSAKIHAKL